jgi:hypothetical protein
MQNAERNAPFLHSEFGIGIEAAFFSNLLGAF